MRNSGINQQAGITSQQAGITSPTSWYDQCRYGNRSVSIQTVLVFCISICVYFASTRQADAQCEVATLTAPQPLRTALFGYAVATDGQLSVVGAPGPDVAHVFRREVSNWVHEATITGSETIEGDMFGGSVSISGDRIVVGAAAAGPGAGAAHVFFRAGTSWSEEGRLTPSDAEPNDLFGYSVSIDGDFVVVGSRQDYVGGVFTGSAYVFSRQGTTWIEEARLTASDASYGDVLGESVAISGAYVLVGAAGHSGAGSNVGAAYIFERTPQGWGERAILTPSNPSTVYSFGRPVAISGDYAVVGSRHFWELPEDQAAPAFVFHRQGTSWIEQARLEVYEPGARFHGETSVSISGDYLLVGTRQIGGGTDTGAAHVYRRDGTEWVKETKLTSNQAAVGDLFAHDVSIGAEHALVGAQYTDGARTDAGVAYLFRALGSPDCNLNGVNDACEDCNGNGVADACDITAGTSNDANGNGLPDDCEDCNNNGIADSIDIDAGTSSDCTGNGTPDECESDCNGNGVPDSCDIDAGTSGDWDSDGLPDECEPGACCNPQTGTCGVVPRQECEAVNGVSLWAGSTCLECVGGSDDGDPCVGENDCPGDPPGVCTTRSECAAGVCCKQATGGCREIRAPDTCVAGEDFLGFDTDCTPNCCEQPEFNGADNCQDVVTHAINVPALGEPAVTVTVTGDNSLATYDDYPDTCDFDQFDPAGTRPDRGWWEAFAIDDCAFVVVDLCCTDPARQYISWAIIPECPCETWILTHGVGGAIDPPPSQCSDWENSRRFFGPLTAGTYYYPIASTPFDYAGRYQLHFTVQACPVNACCFGTTCQMLNEIECVAAGGNFQGYVSESWYLAGPDCDPVSGGLSNPCLAGACCIDTGDCVDDDGAFGRIDEDDCLQLGGTFKLGGVCAADPSPCIPCDPTPGASINPCVPGACCIDQQAGSVNQQAGSASTGECLDDGIFGGPIQEAECLQLGGSFKLDGVCSSDPTPCLPCDTGVPMDAPQADQIPNVTGELVASTKNRFLSFRVDEPGTSAAVQVTFVDLPSPFDVWNGSTMWVGSPSSVSEAGGFVTPIPGSAQQAGIASEFEAATLQCDPLFLDWSDFETVHVYHEAIVPGANFAVRLMSVHCPWQPEYLLSDALDLTTCVWGDVTGGFLGNGQQADNVSGVWSAPDGVVSIPIDTVSLLAKFSGRAGAPIKARADLVPAKVDLRIDITDVVASLDAFRGLPYPFAPPLGIADPCDAP